MAEVMIIETLILRVNKAMFLFGTDVQSFQLNEGWVGLSLRVLHQNLSGNWKHNLKTVRGWLWREDFQRFREYGCPRRVLRDAGMFQRRTWDSISVI